MNDPVLAALSREEALALTQRGGAVRCIGVPEGTEFGIDLRAYAVGARFGGVKMVPTDALHLVTWGTDLTCCGVFLRLDEADVAAMQWNPTDEALEMVRDEGERTRHAQEVARMEHDGALAPYPLATAEQWRELAGHITEGVLRRAGIPVGTATAPSGIDDDELQREIDALQRARGGGAAPLASAAAQQPAAAQPAAGPMPQPMGGAPVAACFVALDPRRSGEGLSGAALSRFHLDRSGWLTRLLEGAYSSDGDDGTLPMEVGDDAGSVDAKGLSTGECALLGELQLSYLLFLRLSSLRALEQWKALLQLLCSCEDALCERPRLYTRVLTIVRAQLALASADAFTADGEGGESFLRASLSTLAAHSHSHAADLATPVRDALRLLWASVRPFGVCYEELVASAADDDDEQPVVVHTEAW